ncbi:MAG: DUF1415 domain-containing protein [Tahibacter sp.]
MSGTPEWSDAQIVAVTQRWLINAVIGLNLCPFAKSVHVKRQIRYAVSGAQNADDLLADLRRELGDLHNIDAMTTDTTLLIHPQALTDFDAYNDFLDVADAALVDLGLDGEIQIASFHPDYRFAGSAMDDVENCTNRSPYPMLHLLREASVERAVTAFPDPDSIVDHNLQTLRMLGHAGWRKLLGDEADAGPLSATPDG